MNKSETNGYLKAIEGQLRAVEAAFDELDRTGDLTDIAFETYRKVRIDIINASQALTTVRGWNAG